MPVALVSKQFVAAFGDELKGVAQRAGHPVEFIAAPVEAGARLSAADCDRIDCAFLDRDMRFNEQTGAVFEEAMIGSKSMRWLHIASSGLTPSAWLDALHRKGATITSSTGSNAEPVAQTGLTGLLMLARGFPTYLRAQAKREWKPLRGAELPDDLRGQTLLLLGVGAVGKVFAGYAKALGLHVVGVRRTPGQPGDSVDEMHHPSQLPELLPRADWIVISCPLTRETRNLLDAAAFERMRKGARVLNIARGEIVDEAALVESLRSGHLAGAYLDAHRQEPLAPDSPLWDMPNVILTPHNASASKGNEKRCAEMFIANFGHWVRREPMFNVQPVM
ncbi:MAG: D-2-hydroxyacid dehydrogenase [Burkholderiales bacterium]